MPTPQELLFARFAADYGLLTPDEEQRCWGERDAAHARGEGREFKAVAEALGVVSPYQIAGIEVLLREQGRKAAGDATPQTSRSTVSGRGRSRAPAPGAAPVVPPVSPTAPDPGFVPRPESAPSAAVGRRAMLGGYTILRELGRGGMGIVYEAIQLRLNRRVALKVLASHEVDAEGLERIKREALAAAKLTHPNVVRVYDAGEEDGLPYFAMEYVPGASLMAWIGKPEMTRERGVRLILQAAEGLQVAHATGIVHRDIKPANLLVGPNDRLVVTDFGLARDAGTATITLSDQVLGTPRYMSPEQANGVRKEVDHRTDIYSLGATLYELATGKPIFEEQDGNLFHQVLMRDPKPPRRHDAGIPVDLETVILKATAKDASSRYVSMADLADDLRRYLEGRPVLARRASWWELSVRAVRRHRLAAAVSCAAVLAFVAVIVALVLRESRRLEAAELVRQARDRTRRVTVSLPATATPDQAEFAAREAYGLFERALADVDRALDLDPTAVFAWRTRAELLLRTGRTQEALTAAERWLAAAPESGEVLYRRARILHDLGPVDRAGAAFDEVLARPLGVPVRDLAEARQALLTRNAETALAALSRPSRAEMDAAEALRVTALAHGLKPAVADKEAAIQAMLASLDCGDSAVGDYLELCHWYRFLGQYDQAVAALWNAMGHGRGAADVHLECGNLAVDAGTLEVAQKHYDRSIELADYAGAHLSRAELFLEKGDRRSALEDYQAAERLAPADAGILSKVLAAYAKVGEEADAARIYAEMRARGALDPAACAEQGPAALRAVVDTLQELGLWDASEEYLRVALECIPGDAEVLRLYGLLCQHRKRHDEAIRHFESALRARPDYVKTLVALSRSHAERKDLKACISCLSRAIRAEPDNRDLYMRRAFRWLQALRVAPALADLESVSMMSSSDEVETRWRRCGVQSSRIVPRSGSTTSTRTCSSS